MITIKTEPYSKKVFIDIENIDENIRRGIRQGFFKLGISLRKTASKQILSKNKTGRLYRIRRGKRIISHRASAPGESPANLSGNYRRNIDFKIHGIESMDFGGNADYSGWLEDGTKRMKPRPGLGNAVKVEKKNGVKYFTNEINRNLIK